MFSFFANVCVHKSNIHCIIRFILSIIGILRGGPEGGG